MCQGPFSHPHAATITHTQTQDTHTTHTHTPVLRHIYCRSAPLPARLHLRIAARIQAALVLTQHGPGLFSAACLSHSPGTNSPCRYLPYLMMNQYRTERVPEDMPTIVLQDAEIRVDITPQYGGKVYAITHVPTGRSMLHTPSTRQPIQSSRLGAQVDGGIEWNWSPGKLGHWVGTQVDVFAARVQTSLGPMVRVYEWDRWNETYFQVDLIVVNGTLFAHPKVWNPNPRQISGYWWTCSGMQFTAPTGENCKSSAGNLGTRILNPASYNVDNTLEAKPWPYAQGMGGNPPNVTKDMSWLEHWTTGMVRPSHFCACAHALRSVCGALQLCEGCLLIRWHESPTVTYCCDSSTMTWQHARLISRRRQFLASSQANSAAPHRN